MIFALSTKLITERLSYQHNALAHAKHMTPLTQSTHIENQLLSEIGSSINPQHLLQLLALHQSMQKLPAQKNRCAQYHTLVQASADCQQVDNLKLNPLPEDLKVSASLAHMMRERGVYSAPVYSADIAVSGAFVTPDLQAVIPNLKSVQWEQAAIVMGLSDLTGLAAAGDLKLGDGKMAFQAGAPAFAGRMFGRIKQSRSQYREGPRGGDARFGAIHARANFTSRATPGSRVTFETAVDLKGSGGFFMAPAAKTSRLSLKGDWPHPSFQGAPLPETREVTDAGFSADWAVPALARGYGAVWHGDHAKSLLADAVSGGIGFRHARPDDFYVGAERAVKYGVLFVALTFLACFVLERFGGRRLHPAQYGLVGLLLALFYLLLISLAERIGFASAYVGAAAVIAVMNGAYVGAALSSLKRGAGAGGSLALLYAAFYVMLMSEDDALLIGSGLLLLGVGLAMAATARIGKRKEAPLPSV